MRSNRERLRVMVVEDDRLLQNIYRETFLTWSLPLDVHLMEHGLDALVEVGREPPDLLIADLRIPGIDGFEMIRRLRADPQLQELDIVVVSGLTEEEILENGGLPPDGAEQKPAAPAAAQPAAAKPQAEKSQAEKSQTAAAPAAKQGG